MIKLLITLIMMYLLFLSLLFAKMRKANILFGSKKTGKPIE